MKNLKKLGKVLSTKEQKNVNGGGGFNAASINMAECMVGGNGSQGSPCTYTFFENGFYNSAPGHCNEGPFGGIFTCVID